MTSPQADAIPFYCPGCGREHKEEGRFCPLCGRDLKAFMDARQRDPLIGKIIDQRYRVIKPIGRGGMGTVYHVEHVAMGKVMAMKLLNTQVRARPHAVRRFRQEIKVVSRLNHVHTVSVFDCGDAEDGSLYIVMEYLRGLDLEKLLQHEKVLPCERTARIARQVCASLADAHTRGVVHRDIKPANIFLLRDGGEYDFVKVLDFGIAKLTEPGQEKVTEIGLIVGTPFYMAPEQAKGSHYLGPATDIYSLGVVMYEMVTGQLPFRGQTVADFIEAHLRHAPLPPSTATTRLIDNELEAIILKAMSKAPEQRFPSIEAMQMALDNYLEHQVQLKARALSISFPPDFEHPSAAPSGDSATTPPPKEPNQRVTERFNRSQAAVAPTDAAPAFREDGDITGETILEPRPKGAVVAIESGEQAAVDGPDTAPQTPGVDTPAEEAQLLEVPPPLPIDDSVPDIPSEILANRADWDRVEARWRRRRFFRRATLFLLLVSIFGSGGYFAWLHKDKLLPQKDRAPDTRTYQREREPNNNYVQATTIPLGQAITGLLGTPVKGHPSDIDWYKVRLPKDTPTIITVSLEPPPFADVELGLYQVSKEQSDDAIRYAIREIQTSNNAMRGGKEMISSFRWSGGDLYILVRELVIPGETAQRGPYRLLVQEQKADPLVEVEPNEQFQQAIPLPLGKTMAGRHDRKDDIDIYRIQLKPNAKGKKRRCRLTLLYATNDNQPELLILNQQGNTLPIASRRYSVKQPLKSPSKAGKRRKRRFIRRKGRLMRLRLTGTYFIRIKGAKHDFENTYQLKLTCR